jgi:hypothetical protein
VLGCAAQTTSEFVRLTSASNKDQRVSQQQSISEKLGIVRCADGRSAVAYRALRTLFCSKCGNTIAESDVFTRWSVQRNATPDAAVIQHNLPLLAARCRECVPFHFKTNAEPEAPVSPPDVTAVNETLDLTTSAQRSKLLEHLLSLPTDLRSAKEARQKPERIVSTAQADSQAITKPESALRTVISEKRESAEPTCESVSSKAAEASYNRLAPALNSRKFRAATTRSAWRNKK